MGGDRPGWGGGSPPSPHIGQPCLDVCVHLLYNIVGASPLLCVRSFGETVFKRRHKKWWLPEKVQPPLKANTLTNMFFTCTPKNKDHHKLTHFARHYALCQFSGFSKLPLYKASIYMVLGILEKTFVPLIFSALVPLYSLGLLLLVGRYV